MGISFYTFMTISYVIDVYRREIEPEANPVLRLIRRVVPVSRTYVGQRFFIREEVEGRVGRHAPTTRSPVPSPLTSPPAIAAP